MALTTGLARKFVRVFPSDDTEKPEQISWATQYVQASLCSYIRAAVLQVLEVLRLLTLDKDTEISTFSRLPLKQP